MEKAVALGNFDGVHKAHRKILNLTAKKAKEKNLIATAFLFKDHPMAVLKKGDFRYIMQNSVKEQKIREAGIEEVIFTETTPEILALSPEDFVFKVLKERLSAKVIVAGYNYTFGKGGKGDSALLSKLCQECSIEAVILDKEELLGSAISSSRIREYIQNGDMQEANALLGGPYTIYGTVTKGKQLGRRIGFPTANIEFEPYMLIPRRGVYKSVAAIEGKNYPAITNIGINPTIENAAVRAECHILYFEKDIYGKEIEIGLIEKIRDEIKFDSIEELKKQIEKDKNYVLNSLEEVL